MTFVAADKDILNEVAFVLLQPSHALFDQLPFVAERLADQSRKPFDKDSGDERADEHL